MGGALIVSEVALALVLLAGAGLLSRSFLELVRVEPGFQSGQVMTLRVTLPALTYDTDEKIRDFSRNLFERIERLPDIQAVGSVGYLPMSNIGVGDEFEIEGRPTAPGNRPGAWINTVGGRYFEAMRVPLIRGRLPDRSDSEHTQPVFVIDEELAGRYWPNENPIGARLIWREDGKVKLAGEVIGIVGNVRWIGRAASVQRTAYFWFPRIRDARLPLPHGQMEIRNAWRPLSHLLSARSIRTSQWEKCGRWTSSCRPISPALASRCCCSVHSRLRPCSWPRSGSTA